MVKTDMNASAELVFNHFRSDGPAKSGSSSWSVFFWLLVQGIAEVEAGGGGGGGGRRSGREWPRCSEEVVFITSASGDKDKTPR
ncbi:hypothetical protein EYF80_031218 [Liparis tanakae]|uniref:Uncharacterized protein n=1 Tax=Liparis tanakae TaxID=230148 RepID=A0A4Z2GYB1_9TELE|nr:hypothetical protein EYF80_031218 [Liparis tanakae]